MKKIIIFMALAKLVYGADYSNWMSNNYQKLKNKPLNQITLLGSHDAGSYAIKPNSAFCRGEAIAGRVSINFEYMEANQTKTNLTITQKDNIASQLNNGVRYFDMRVCHYKDNFYTSHYYVSDKYSNILPAFAKFAKKHPHELIILDFDKHLYGDKGYLTTTELDNLVEVITQKLNFAIINPSAFKAIGLSKYSDVIDKGNILMITSNPYLLGKYKNLFLDRHSYLDSQWANQPDSQLLMSYLESNVIPTWNTPTNKNKLKVLQAQITMPNTWEAQLWMNQNLIHLARTQTNPLLIKYLNNEWKQQNFNIIMVDDASNSNLMSKYIIPKQK